MTEFYWNPDENRAEVRRSVGKSSVTFPCRTSLDEFDVLCLRSAVIHYFPLTKGYNL